LKTGRDVVIGGILGADEFGFSTTALVSLGCILMRKCHLNTCSVGIATQDPELRRKFAGKPEYVVNQFRFIAQETREIMAELGIRKFEDLIGRVELLDSEDVVDHWKLKGIDYTKILYKPDVPETVAIRHVTSQDHTNVHDVLDKEIIEKAKPALENEEKVQLEFPIGNTDRTVGAQLSYQISKKHGEAGLQDDSIYIKFNGSAGQSFGAFLAPGITFELSGDANDYVGKSLSGGNVIIYPPAESTIVPEENIIAGNVLLYGATAGKVYMRGVVGERFAVRNSGAQAVVEGVGDHACEYMTGGLVVVLGGTGRNFAAGMSGGISYVWDKNKDFEVNCNLGLVDLEPVEEEEDIEILKGMVQDHLQYTKSTVAQDVLDRWEEVLPQFVKVYPRDYRRVLEERKKKRMEESLEEVA
jgi:glutamate synthase (NADPH) large chain